MPLKIRIKVINKGLAKTVPKKILFLLFINIFFSEKVTTKNQLKL